MLTQGLLERIGFSDEQIQEYNKYDSLYGDEVEKFAVMFMVEKADFKETLSKLHERFENIVHSYTIDLIFVLHCTEFLRLEYKNNNIDEELFYNAMNDITYKLRECISVQKVFGHSNVANWYFGFFVLRRFALGRLQYDILEFPEDDITVLGKEIKKGSFVLGCHIPSSGRLTQELCLESYKKAYEFFKDRLDEDGILVIRCASWLLYEPYLDVFGAESNTGLFMRNFSIYSNLVRESFQNGWRLFGVDCPADVDPDTLPSDTTMRRSFIDYMKKGGIHGVGIGVILFDGEKILTNH